MLPFGVTIPATVTQGSEIPERLMNNPVYKGPTRGNFGQYCFLLTTASTHHMFRTLSALLMMGTESVRNVLIKSTLPKVASCWFFIYYNLITPIDAPILPLPRPWYRAHLSTCLTTYVDGTYNILNTFMSRDITFF